MQVFVMLLLCFGREAESRIRAGRKVKEGEMPNPPLPRFALSFIIFQLQNARSFSVHLQRTLQTLHSPLIKSIRFMYRL